MITLDLDAMGKPFLAQGKKKVDHSNTGLFTNIHNLFTVTMNFRA
jgi:hypothetical protein